jgi:hypothetical protein
VRRLVAFLLVFLAAEATAAAPPLLDDAIRGLAVNFDHWAYTHTIIQRDGNGKVTRSEVIRFDPSKPYAEQFTPLSIDGREPTDRQRQKYRREGVRRGERLMKGETGADKTRKTLGELMDIDRAVLSAEDATSVTYTEP